MDGGAGIPSLEGSIGPLPRATLVQVYGAPATGKTTLALQLARTAARPVLVLPERPHPDRLAQLLGLRRSAALVAQPADLDAQDRAVARAAALLARGRTGCVVLDSLTYFYRFEQMASTDALRRLLRQLHRLRQAARTGGGWAVFTNQVRGTGDRERALGGPAVGHITDLALRLSVLDGPWRRLRVTKHPAAPAGGAWDARIGEDGFEG